MKTIERRIFRLEKRVRTQRLDTGPSPADLMRQRRRRWMEAEGIPYEEPAPCSSDALSVVEILRQSLAKSQAQRHDG